jgi:hypothetical protein
MAQNNLDLYSSGDVDYLKPIINSIKIPIYEASLLVPISARKKEVFSKIRLCEAGDYPLLSYHEDVLSRFKRDDIINRFEIKDEPFAFDNLEWDNHPEECWETTNLFKGRDVSYAFVYFTPEKVINAFSVNDDIIEINFKNGFIISSNGKKYPLKKSSNRYRLFEYLFNKALDGIRDFQPTDELVSLCANSAGMASKGKSFAIASSKEKVHHAASGLKDIGRKKLRIRELVEGEKDKGYRIRPDIECN